MNKPTVQILAGDVREMLRTLPADSVQCVITSPPYWGLRDYSVEGQLGSEKMVEQFVENMVSVFREVKRVLRSDGNLYLNLGDCYARNPKRGVKFGKGEKTYLTNRQEAQGLRGNEIPAGVKEKDLIGVPWLVAFALRADGWYLREDIIWHKPNPMPESIMDRCTRSHEYIFHLTKSPRYYYDNEAIKEPYAKSSEQAYGGGKVYNGQAQKDYDSAKAQNPSDSKRRMMAAIANGSGRNKRDVWIIPVQPYRGGHFATFPEKLVQPCVLAGSSEGGQCSSCGLPFRRIVEREPIPDDIRQKFEDARARTAADTGRTDGHTNYKPNFRRDSRTIGWKPECQCGAPPVPQTVLDPFVGSGRSGIVATRLGRNFIGIDLNPGYVEQAIVNITGKAKEETAA